MQSATTKRAVVIAGCTNLGMNEEQPTQGGEFSCATKPAICIPPSVSACYRRSHRRRPSRDLPAERACVSTWSTFRLAVLLQHTVLTETEPDATRTRIQRPGALVVRRGQRYVRAAHCIGSPRIAQTTFFGVWGGVPRRRPGLRRSHRGG